jgi:hypothetical protein
VPLGANQIFCWVPIGRKISEPDCGIRVTVDDTTRSPIAALAAAKAERVPGNPAERREIEGLVRVMRSMAEMVLERTSEEGRREPIPSLTELLKRTKEAAQTAEVQQ